MSGQDRPWVKQQAWKTICEFFGLADGLPAITLLPGLGATPIAQTATHLYGGSGVPSNSNGANGDFYLRSDGSTGTFIYHKAAGSWTAFA